MRRVGVPLYWVVFLASLSLGQSALGRDTCTVSKDPQFDAKTLKIECDNGEPVQQYLSESVCGGADRTISVVGSSSSAPGGKAPAGGAASSVLGKNSYIAKVTGVPGREGDPLGGSGGMAKRIEKGGNYNDGFQFPDSAQGVSTVCVPGKTSAQHNVFHCTDGSPDGTDGCIGERQEETYAYPYFQDPPCRWRLSGGRWPDPQHQQYSAGDFDEKTADAQTPDLCADFGGYLNQWQYEDCIHSGYDDNGDLVCEEWGDRYICDDQEVNNTPDVHVGVEDFGWVDWPNASGCAGENCRCSGLNSENWCPVTPEPADFEMGVTPTDLPYRSVFRQYNAGYERKALTQYVPKDKAKVDSTAVACYGFYDEYDPKYKQTTTPDYRCVIDLNDTEKRKQWQLGKGSFNSSQPEQDPPKPVTFNQKQDSWWELLAGGFSLLSPLQNDLSQALPDILTAKTKAVQPAQSQSSADTIYRGMPTGGYVDDFDDTGPLRTVVRWWHKQETDANTLLSPPVLRLVHVPAWALGLDSSDPLFQSGSSASSSLSQWTDVQTEPIDAQIRAHDDLIGTILASINRSLLSVQEEPLPVVVPFGDPTEFRARAQALCNWYLANHPDAGGCDGVSGKAKTVMNTLEQYATQIEQVRRLRLQLATVAGALLQVQSKMIAPLHQWSQKNLQLYAAYLQQKNMVLSLQNQWQQAAQDFVQFNEKTNAPWCMNDRYTTAIYSLLDPWLPARPDNGNALEHANGGGAPYETYDSTAEPSPGGQSGGGEEVLGDENGQTVGANNTPSASPADLPSLEEIPVHPSQDIVMDLSLLQNIPAPLKLPVLKVTMVQLDLQKYLPPSTGSVDALPDIKPLPSLDPVIQAMKDINKTLPTVCGPSSSSSSSTSSSSDSSDDDLPKRPCMQLSWPDTVDVPKLWAPDDEAEIYTKIGEITQVIDGMTEAYDNFWKSLNIQNDQQTEKDKDQLKCKAWDTTICMNVEMDLLERFTRIAARPDVELKEDFNDPGIPQQYGASCLPDDRACLLLNPEKTYAPAGWQAKTGSSSAGAAQQSGQNGAMTVDDLRKKLRDNSLPKPFGTVDTDTYPAYITDPQDLLPIFDVPRPSPLTISSSSASGTP